MISLKRTNFLMLFLLAGVISFGFYYFYTVTKSDYQKTLNTNIQGDILEVGYFVMHSLDNREFPVVADTLERATKTHHEYEAIAVVLDDGTIMAAGTSYETLAKKKSVNLEVLSVDTLYDDKIFRQTFTYPSEGKEKAFDLLVDLDNDYLRQNEKRLVARTVTVILFFIALMMILLASLYLTNIRPLIRLTAFIRGDRNGAVCRFREFALLKESFVQKFNEVNELNLRLEEKVIERTEKLAETNRMYEEIQHLASLGSWEWDMQSNALFWSDEIYRIFGREPQEFAATYEAFIHTVHPEDRQMVRDAVNEAIGSGKEYSIKHRIVLSDGMQKNVHERGRVEFDQAGAPVRMIGSVQDITLTQKRQEELTLQAAVLNLVADSIFVHGDGEKFIYVNEAAYKTRGYTKDELLQMSIKELDAPMGKDEAEAHMHRIKQQIEANGTAIFEVEQRKKNGRLIPVEIRTQWLDIGGRKYFISIARDMTERKKNQAALETSEKKFKGIVENSLVGVFRTDMEGNVLYVNEATVKIMEYDSAGELLASKSMIHYQNPDDRSQLLEELREKGFVNSFEVELFTHRMNPRTILMSARLIDNQLNGMIMDVTEQKRIYHEVIKLSRAVEEIDDVVVLTDPEGVITYVNHAFEKHTGFVKAEVLGKTSRILKSGKHEPVFYKKMWATILEGRDYKGLVINRKKDGELYHEAKTISPIRNERGEITAFVSTGKDMTEEEKYKKGLEEKVTREMERRMEQDRLIIQQSKMAAMGEMVGAIAHQWKQPLNTLSIIVQDLEDAYAYNELDKEYLHQGVESSIEQINYMSQTIDDFRNFFKPDKSKSVFNMEQAVKTSVDLLAKQLTSSDIRYGVSCLPEGNICDICCEGYQSEFKQVVINIVNNAKDAILESRAQGRNVEGNIRLVVKHEKEKAVLLIEDDGGGIKEEVIGRVFDSYFTTKSEAKGTGLGLYMAKLIIEEHMAGKISVSNADEGARFTIELPFADCSRVI